MTGKHIGHARVRGNACKNNPLAQSLRSTDVTVARLLKDAGYSTGLIGKWGLGDVGSAPEGLPRRHGFDYFFGYLNQQHAHNYFPTFLWRNETKVELHNVVPAEEPSGAGVATERRQYAHDLLAAETLKFIRHEINLSFSTSPRPFPTRITRRKIKDGICRTSAMR
jgi:arylsulfatase A-like enzyme